MNIAAASAVNTQGARATIRILKRALPGCPGALAAGYTVDGHELFGDLACRLGQRPAALGIATHGMPNGSQFSTDTSRMIRTLGNLLQKAQ